MLVLIPHFAVELVSFDNIAVFVAYKQYASGQLRGSATAAEEARK